MLTTHSAAGWQPGCTCLPWHQLCPAGSSSRSGRCRKRPFLHCQTCCHWRWGKMWKMAPARTDNEFQRRTAAASVWRLEASKAGTDYSQHPHQRRVSSGVKGCVVVRGGAVILPRLVTLCVKRCSLRVQCADWLEGRVRHRVMHIEWTGMKGF